MTTGEVWTHETLLCYLNERIDALRRENNDRDRLLMQVLDERRDAIHMALDKNDKATNARFGSVNEFRATLSDQAATFLTRTEYDLAHAALSDRVNTLSDRMTKVESRAVGLNAGWLYLLGFIAAIGTLVSIYLALIHG